MVGAVGGCMIGILFLLVHPTGSYLAEELAGIALTFIGAVVGTEVFDR